MSKPLYQQKVIATSKFAGPGSFSLTVQALASEPITLAELVIQARDAFAAKFTTKKEPTFVACIRVRDALKPRFGYLRKADTRGLDQFLHIAKDEEYEPDLTGPHALTVADAVWIGTALLQREDPDQFFSVKAIVDQVDRLRLTRGEYGSIWQHVNQHCVANRKPQPNRSRMLLAVGEGERRLYRAVDPFDPAREGAQTHPNWVNLPQEYRDLQVWYEEEWHFGAGKDGGDPLLALAGTGKGLFGQHGADAYVDELRSGWEFR